MSTDPLATALMRAADMDTKMQVWEYDFERLARCAREFIAADTLAACPDTPACPDCRDYANYVIMRRPVKAWEEIQ